MSQVVEADLTWTGSAFVSGVQIAIDSDGHVASVGKLGHQPTERLSGQAILPGFVNAHSHAFQRGLRGAGERFPSGGGDFWSWRDAMYQLVETISPDGFYQLCVSAYREMLDRGITAVGEFHYLHHSTGANDYTIDDLVLQAASEAGIRIVLLEAYYHTGGFGTEASSSQRRFLSPGLEAYWNQVDRLAARLDERTQGIGIVAHSLRAVGLDDVTSLHAEATRRGLVLHLHVEEQQREIDECVAHYGRRPLALVNELGDLKNVTAVHCTHTDAADMQQFLEAGGAVCVCPLTEANLGDGIPDLALVHRADRRLSLGTDSNARISMLEEMRWLEYGQRLASKTRGILADSEGSIAKTLLEAATEGGAQSLGIRAGRIAPGYAADLVSIDLETPSLAGCHEDILLESLIFGGGDDTVRATCVGGQWRNRSR